MHLRIVNDVSYVVEIVLEVEGERRISYADPAVAPVAECMRAATSNYTQKLAFLKRAKDPLPVDGNSAYIVVKIQWRGG